MNLSMKWLKEFVDIDVDPKEFADKMTMSGSKVEGFEDDGGKINNVVVGKILSIDKHPNADKLSVCKVDVKSEAPLQIITSAKNIQIGDLVPIALHNSTIADGTKITKGKLRGIQSEGMMCSMSELGISKADFPSFNEDGILINEEKQEIVSNKDEVTQKLKTFLSQTSDILQNANDNLRDGTAQLLYSRARQMGYSVEQTKVGNKVELVLVRYE